MRVEGAVRDLETLGGNEVPTQESLQIPWLLVQNGRIVEFLQRERLLHLVVFIRQINGAVDGSVESEGKSGEFRINPRLGQLIIITGVGGTRSQAILINSITS